MEKLEVKRDHITVETLYSANFPAKLPVIVRYCQFRAAGYVLHGLLVGHLLHGQAILCQNSSPLTCGHGLHIERSQFMYFLDSLEERLWVIWEEARVRERGVT